MHSSVGGRPAWDCSEDEFQFEDVSELEPYDEMLPIEEELDPEATLQSPANPISFAVNADAMPQDPDDAVSLASPELPLSASDHEAEPTASSSQSSIQNCEKLRLIAPPPV